MNHNYNGTPVTGTEFWIINYLSTRDWCSPTDIGNSYCKGYQSAWASPKCKKLVEKGIIEVNEKRQYKLIIKDEHPT